MKSLTFSVFLTLIAASAFAQTSTREEFQQYCRALEGRWVNSDEKLAADLFGVAEGQTATSYAELKLVADGHALEGVWYCGDRMAKWMTTWDPASKQIQRLTIFSDGTLWREVRHKKGNDWACHVTLTFPDGTQKTIQSLLTITDGGNTHTYTAADGEDGEPGVYRRVNTQSSAR